MKKLESTCEVLNKDELNRIHRSSMNLLEEAGVKVPHDRCLEICESAGAKVDESDKRIRIPEKVTENFLAEVGQKELDEAGKDPDRLTGHISTQLKLAEYDSGEGTYVRRSPWLEDVKRGVTVVEELDNFPSCNAAVLPENVPDPVRDVKAYEILYKYSSKPGGTYVLSPKSGRYIIEMSKVVNEETSYLLETVSPLGFTSEGLELSLMFAREGFPIEVGPMPIGGATAPITMAGTLVLVNAEILASLFVIFAAHRHFGTDQESYRYNCPAHTMDLQTTLCSFGSPNQALFGVAAAQLGDFYGFEPSSNSGLSDSMLADFQAGFEKSLSTSFSWLAGSMGIGGQGIVGADQAISLEQLVIDNEWMDAYNHVLEGVEVTDDTLAEGLLREVGTDGSFLNKKHTVKHMHDSYWETSLFNRDSWEGWAKNDKKGTLEQAHEYLQNVLDNRYPPEPVLDKQSRSDIDDIVDEAVKEVSNEG